MAEVQGITMEAKTSDNKIWVQSSARPIGTYTCFTSEGDNTSAAHYVGGGVRLMNHHEVGDSTVNVIYADFNTAENKTFMQEGYGMWSNAYYDTLTLEVVPDVTPYTDSSNTNFYLYNGYLVLPAAGNGNISIQPEDIKLVQIPMSLDDPSKRQSPAFWNATYDTTNHQYINITPAPYGDGTFNIFGSEVIFQRPANMMMLASGNLTLKSDDIAELVPGIRLKFTFTTDASTDGTDHEWQMAVILKMHRKYVSNF